MPTFVQYCGSPWSEDRDTLAKLYTMLQAETLDPIFERYGDFCMRAERAIIRHFNEGGDPRATAPMSESGSMHFWGNFYSYSCAFSVYTDEDDVIAKLIALIKANKATLAYKEARDERKAEHAAKLARERDIMERHRKDRALADRYRR